MSTAQIIADLARAKATFQLRAIKAAMGWPYAIRDSDRSGEAGETGDTGSTEGESAGRQASPMPCNCSDGCPYPANTLHCDGWSTWHEESPK